MNKKRITRWLIETLVVGLMGGIMFGILIERQGTRMFQREVEVLLQLLTPEMEWVRPKVQVLEDSFGIDRLTALKILSEVWKASQFFDHNPDMILAQMELESSFNNNALSSIGAMGLMQVMPEWWRQYNPNANPFGIKENIRMGNFVLWVYKNISASDEEALARYYAGGNWDKFLTYSEKVQNKFIKWNN